MKKPADLSTLLPTLFSGKPLGMRLRESAVWRVWDGAVGPQIAAKARPVALREGVLTVAVSSSPWLQQLGFLRQQLIAAVNGALGEELVKEIYLKAGTFSPPAPPRCPPPRPSRPLTPEERARIEGEAAAIPDEALRAAVIRCHLTWARTMPPATEVVHREGREPRR